MTRNKKIILIAIGVLALIIGYLLMMREQKIRDRCYAVGIAHMPPTTDQSRLQSVPAYQDCIIKAHSD